jgi:molecular chaperone GrpE (heat shock protein)
VFDMGAGVAAEEAVLPEQVPDDELLPPAEDRPTPAAQELAAQTAELQDLRRAVEAFHDRSRAQEDVIGRMQARIEDLQADQVRALLGPVATQLATLHGELSELGSRDADATTTAQVLREVGLLVQRVEAGLESLGMETVDAAPGVPFDRRRHTAVRRVPTGDRELDQTVASVVRQGFCTEGAERASVMARVTVFQYDPASAGTDES